MEGDVGNPVLVLEGVGKRYAGAERPALRDVDLAVTEGEVLALVGESGSGKTTLLKTVNRLVAPSRGTVTWKDTDVADLDPVELRRRIGYVQQEGGLIPHWTVGRNVELVPRLLGWDEDERRERSRELLSLVHLEPDQILPRYPKALSGGQRQRVAVARALAARPDLVLFDEPFGALDAVTRSRLHRLFQEVRDELGFTALFVTHDLGEAFLLADRIAVLYEAEVLQVATPEALETSPEHPYVEKLLSLRVEGASAGAAS